MLRCPKIFKTLVGSVLKNPVFGVVTLFVLVLVATWFITQQMLVQERKMAHHNARVHQESLAFIISENLAQLLDKGALLALASAEWFDGNSTEASTRLEAMLSLDHAFVRMALYDMHLKRVYSSSASTDSDLLTQSIRATLEDKAASGLHVGPVSTLQEKMWQVPLLFPMPDKTGRIHGIFMVVLDLGYLLGLYQNIDIGRTGAIQILRRNGEEIARARQGGLELSKQPWQTALLPFSGERHGSVVTDLFDDGRPCQVSFRHLVPFPFLVVVSRDLEEMYADYGINGSRFPPTLWLITAFMVGALCWIASTIQKREQLVVALKAADLDKRTLILQLQEEAQRVLKLATHDPLTSLPNRRMFFELGASHIARARRSRKHYGLMYVDLDRFKFVNDTLGHHVGDLLLQTVATRLSAALRESDLVARLGGDEFAILLTELDNVEHITEVASKMVELISRPYVDLDGHDLQVRPSIGIAVFPRDGHNVDILSRNADAAMYQSKRAGRGRYTFYEPSLNPPCDRQFELEQRLPQAIADNELVVYFQPKVRLADYRIVGFEALVRWDHPQHGLIQPGEFIPIAESTGLDMALGDWVVQACCHQLSLWQAQGLAIVPIAVNVTARQLRDEQLPGRIAACLGQAGLSAHLLAVEITESCLVEPVELAVSVLSALEKIGVGIALDDFGNGYSSFNYIRTLPIHTIKIDRSFISEIRNIPSDAVIVSSIVTLAHNLKKNVVAEGVELLEQLVHLKTVGCDEVQGYLLSRPMPAEAARNLLIQSYLKPE